MAMTIDRRFALLARDGDILYPYMKSEKTRNLFGFAMSEEGKRDAKGLGRYTMDLREVISNVVKKGWGVRVKSDNRSGNTLGLNKRKVIGYWIAPELIDVVRDAKVKPITPSEYEAVVGRPFPAALRRELSQRTGSSTEDRLAAEKPIRDQSIGESDVQSTKIDASASESDLTDDQGYETDPIIRAAIEKFAVEQARHYYESMKYRVTEFGKPFDLLCQKGEELIHVEVKGSRNRLLSIVVTTNEVEDARNEDWRSDLFIVDGIVLDFRKEAGPKCSGGYCRLMRNWNPDDRDLRPTEYRYKLPNIPDIGR